MPSTSQSPTAVLLDAAPAPVCVVALCGLPASGKTATCRALALNPPDGITVKHIEFDEFLRHNITEAVFQPAIWRAARADALRAVRAAIEAAGSTQRTLLLVDDNGYYQSMRRNILRIAQQGGAAFMQLYLPVSLDVALARNSDRPIATRVPVIALQRMAGLLQPPHPSHHAWERATITWDFPLEFSHPLEGSWVEKLWAALMGMWGEPVLPPDDGLASLEAREATASSNLHQLDLRLRHAMAGAVAQLRGCGGEGAGRGAQLLSEARRSLLGRARAQLGKGVAVVDAVESAEVAFAETCAAILTHDAH